MASSSAPQKPPVRKRKAETVIDPVTNEEVAATLTYCPGHADEELKCGICLGTISNPLTVIPCIHRFCSECLQRSLRVGFETKTTHSCPLCRVKMVSRRASKPDPTFDALIGILEGDTDDRCSGDSALLDAAKASCQKHMAATALLRNRAALRNAGGGSGIGSVSGSDGGGIGGGGIGGSGGGNNIEMDSQRKIANFVASRRNMTFKVSRHPSETRLSDVPAPHGTLRMCDERGHYASAMHVKQFIAQRVSLAGESAVATESLELFAANPHGDAVFALDDDTLLIELIPLFDDAVQFILLTYRLRCTSL